MQSDLNPINRYAIGIEFNGTHFQGWQAQQHDVRSVQETLETVLSRIANEPIIVHGAGRTDAGVHACNMVAHFDTSAIRPEHGWLRGANTQLPKDVSIQWIQKMNLDFHARFKACARRYRYIIYHSPYRPSLLWGQVTHIYHPLNIQQMMLAAKKFEGTHHFESFRAAACQSNQPIRHVSHCQLTQQGPFLILDIQADGFLHHMVRNIMGCLLDIGRERYPIHHIDEIFAAKNRSAAGVTAPPQGLYFINAYYPKQFQLPNIQLGPAWLNLTTH